MTILINLVAAPSVGKTTLAYRVLAFLKDLEMNVEFSPEYVKTWVWSGRTVSHYDQFYIFGKECHAQSSLFNKVDVILSDSPVMLTAFYHYYYNGQNSLRQICRDFYTTAKEKDNVECFNFYLPRMKTYKTEGRYQTQEEADRLAIMLKDWLNTEPYEYEELTCPDEDRLPIVLSRIAPVLKNPKLDEALKDLLLKENCATINA